MGPAYQRCASSGGRLASRGVTTRGPPWSLGPLPAEAALRRYDFEIGGQTPLPPERPAFRGAEATHGLAIPFESAGRPASVLCSSALLPRNANLTESDVPSHAGHHRKNRGDQQPAL